jgi:hypothetical protein
MPILPFSPSQAPGTRSANTNFGFTRISNANNGTGGACGTYGGGKTCIQGSSGETCRRVHLVETGLDGWIILK